MKKRELRIFSMQILYNMELNNTSLDEALANIDDENYDNEAKEFILGILDKKDEIDDIISKNLKGYTISRLNLVDKQIIRIATYEMLKGNLDIKIIMNEALEITKLFSDEGNHKAVSFNNRLLQNIYQSLNEGD